MQREPKGLVDDGELIVEDFVSSDDGNCCNNGMQAALEQGASLRRFFTSANVAHLLQGHNLDN